MSIDLETITRLNDIFKSFRSHSEEYRSNIGKGESAIYSFKHLITKDAPELLSAGLSGTDLIVKGSVGVGRISACPWLAIMDKRITSSAQEGVYLVFLFSQDLMSLYLTVNQGTTLTDIDVYEKTRNDLRAVFPREYCRYAYRR